MTFQGYEFIVIPGVPRRRPVEDPGQGLQPVIEHAKPWPGSGAGLTMGSGVPAFAGMTMKDRMNT
jgi:hypothetical protein